MVSSCENDDLTMKLGAIEAEMGKLSDWERGFIKNQLDRHAQYGADTRVSPKQWAVINRVYEKLTGDQGELPPPDESQEDYE